LLIFVVSLIGLLGIGAIVVTALWIPNWRSRLEDEAKLWPMTEATVQGSEMRANGRYDQLPSFIFSYAVGGEYYSGWFALSAHGDRADTLLKEMIDKKVVVRYDPNQPSKFYVSDETIDGCEVKNQGEV
jgi:Protein of unknown function (DUF3592)/Mu transposase, C-terminal